MKEDGRIILESKTRYIIGRWNPERLKCEYLSSWEKWYADINKANTYVKGRSIRSDAINDIKHHPKFISKVFVVKSKKAWGMERTKLRLTKLNHWQKMEAMMEI